MKNLSEMELKCGREEVVARFGQGRLVQLSRTKVELRGGSRDDEIEASSWVAMFMPDVVLGKGKPRAEQHETPRGLAEPSLAVTGQAVWAEKLRTVR